MKIYIEKIPPEGLSQEEAVSPASLDLDTEIVKFVTPVKIKADISRITNAVSVDLALESAVHFVCSRCLEEFEIDFKKKLKLNYPVTKSEHIIDMSNDIREEVVLDYPIKPLCRLDCKGLCVKCGKNLNNEICKCK